MSAGEQFSGTQMPQEVFPVSMPRTWLHPVGFGTLGFGLPIGIGAKFGVGEKPVAVLIGDYGIQYTIIKYKLIPFVNVVLIFLMVDNTITVEE